MFQIPSLYDNNFSIFSTECQGGTTERHSLRFHHLFKAMNYFQTSNEVLPSREASTAVRTRKSSRNNSEFIEKTSDTVLSSEFTKEIRKKDSSVLTLPRLMFPALHPGSDIHPVLTKPQLLRKKDSDIKRYKAIIFKKTMDCANAISGEQYAKSREEELRRKLRELRYKNEVEMKSLKLRNKEMFLNETEKLRWQRDESQRMIENKDILIKRLRMRVGQLEELEKQKEKEIKQIYKELENKKIALKNLLRKLILSNITNK